MDEVLFKRLYGVTTQQMIFAVTDMKTANHA